MKRKKARDDKYVHGMGWGNDEVTLSDLTNYRKYQYGLISKYIGNSILEVGSGDRGFTEQIISSKSQFNRLLSIEPSKTLYDQFENRYNFPSKVSFECVDLFDMDKDKYGSFDTIFFVHVLEHILEDRRALDKSYELLEPNGHVLIEVPALEFLFSVHDELLGHHRRYNKKSLKNIIDREKFKIKKIWYQDPIGVIGSFYFFKMKKIKLDTESGVGLVKNQGKFYDKYVIPFQDFIEKFMRFPIGLSLTAILQKKS
ncbi:class I SAM-dependent methyltransferase [bacterium BMS3Abin03]|nr:class I SAM-dependent methyltransferase [bacterium BMS3Abin03]